MAKLNFGKELIYFVKTGFKKILWAMVAVLMAQTFIAYYFSHIYVLVAELIVSVLLSLLVYYMVWFASNYGVDMGKLKYFKLNIVGPAILTFAASFLLMYSLSHIAMYMAEILKIQN